VPARKKVAVVFLAALVPPALKKTSGAPVGSVTADQV
jgi:hypothetical protein